MTRRDGRRPAVMTAAAVWTADGHDAHVTSDPLDGPGSVLQVCPPELLGDEVRELLSRIACPCCGLVGDADVVLHIALLGYLVACPCDDCGAQGHRIVARAGTDFATLDRAPIEAECREECRHCGARRPVGSRLPPSAIVGPPMG